MIWSWNNTWPGMKNREVLSITNRNSSWAIVRALKWERRKVRSNVVTFPCVEIPRRIRKCWSRCCVCNIGVAQGSRSILALMIQLEVVIKTIITIMSNMSLLMANLTIILGSLICGSIFASTSIFAVVTSSKWTGIVGDIVVCDWAGKCSNIVFFIRGGELAILDKE